MAARFTPLHPPFPLTLLKTQSTTSVSCAAGDVSSFNNPTAVWWKCPNERIESISCLQVIWKHGMLPLKSRLISMQHNCHVWICKSSTSCFSCSILILWYPRWLQSSGLQSYLMLIVHMKENLYEAWVLGTDGASQESTLQPPSLPLQPGHSIPQFLVSGDF